MSEPRNMIAAEVQARVARVIPPGSALCVGLSGGLDSTVLLAMFAEHAVPAGYKVSALHVNHGLSPNADAWARHCERVCANQGVPLAIEHVRVSSASPEGLEAAARTAR